MQWHKVTKITQKSKFNKCNAAAAELEHGHNFRRPKSRPRIKKNFQAKDRIFEDKCTQGEIEAGAEADFATFWLECSWSVVYF